MTEFDLALDFVQSYVAAAERGELLDDASEFSRFCDRYGIQPTAERRELVRDIAGVVKECIAAESEEETVHLIPADSLTEGLERYGWRQEYLHSMAAN